MTVDIVAAPTGPARATIYPRWPTKADLVLEAVAGLSRADADHLRPTGHRWTGRNSSTAGARALRVWVSTRGPSCSGERQGGHETHCAGE